MSGQDMMPEPESFEELSLKDRHERHDKVTEKLLKTLQKEQQEAIERARRKPAGTTVDGPAHYNGYQVLEAICDAGFGRGFCLGNAVKYILRAEKKGKDKEDLEKARFYLDWYLDHFYDDNEGNVGE